MIPISIVTRTALCPRCHTGIRRGLPRFGPPQVICPKCGLLINTQLTPWKDIPFLSKPFVALGEIIAPSRFGPFFYAIFVYIMVNISFFIVFGCMLFSLAAQFSATPGEPDWRLLWLLVPINISLPIIRLVLLIRESNAYSQTGEPPVWKPSKF